MLDKRRKFINQWVSLWIGGETKRAKIIDVEFRAGVKSPLFCLVTTQGRKFHMTRKELKYYECADNC